MSFDQIISEELLSLKTESVTIKGKDKKSYVFTVTELSPFEMSRCLDDFGEVDIISIIYRSVRDENNNRMSKDQANRLPPELIATFMKTYNGFFKDTKKKPVKKRQKRKA